MIKLLHACLVRWRFARVRTRWVWIHSGLDFGPGRDFPVPTVAICLTVVIVKYLHCAAMDRPKMRADTETSGGLHCKNLRFVKNVKNCHRQDDPPPAHGARLFAAGFRTKIRNFNELSESCRA